MGLMRNAPKTIVLKGPRISTLLTLGNGLGDGTGDDCAVGKSESKTLSTSYIFSAQL